jgi:hypothetical protein
MSRSITTWNVRSLTRDKVEHIRRFLQARKPLVMLLTETHRTSASPLEWPRFHGYTLFPLPGISSRAGGLAFLLRSDCLAWTGPSAGGAAVLPGLNVGGQSARDANTSSQWAAFELKVHGDSHPIWLVGAYLQPPVTRVVQTELLKQLKQAVDALATLPAGSSRAPRLLLCGDFNQHDGSLAAVDGDAHSELLEELERLGFHCCNSRSSGAFTHSSGSVLDLFLELAQPAAPPLVRCVEVDNSAPRTGAPPALPGSDHFAATAVLFDTLPRLPPAHTFYKWRTDALSADAEKAFVAHLERAFGGMDLVSQEELEDPLQQRVFAAMVDLHSFKVSSSRAAEVHTGNYKAKAQPIADKAWNVLSSALHAIAARHIGQRARSCTEESGWTKVLHHLHKQQLSTEAAWRRRPWDVVLHASRAKAQREFREAMAERQQARWKAIKSAVEEASPDAKRQIAWAAVTKFKRSRELFSSVGAGVKNADGSLCTTEAESRRALAAHFKQQMSTHDLSGGDSVDTSALDEELAERALPPLNCTLDRLSSEHLLTTPDSFGAVLSRSSTRTAAGPDELSGAILRLATKAAVFTVCITALVNFCFAFHVLPQGWRDANLMPLLKKSGDASNPASFRPISITSLLMRRVERLMEGRVKERLEKQLSPWQAGFRRRRSTRQQVLYLQHAIARATRRGAAAGHLATPYPVAFLDISRAFDSVPHQFLLLKLVRMGIRGHDLQFFSAFLSGRRFRVTTLNGLDDRWTAITAGVPQGAVLSPLLYAVFINDIQQPLGSAVAFKRKAGHLLYADDLVLAPSAKHDVTKRHEQLQRALTAVGEWAKRWGVRFSSSKSGVVWFHKTGGAKASLAAARALPALTIPHAAGQAAQLPYVEEYQYLGVWLNAKLSAHSHFRFLAAKCAHTSALLRGVQSPDAPPGPDVVRTLVKALLLSRISYGLPFFTPTKQMCARLNALLFRPLLTALALPASVHRASAAVYTALPMVQVQRDKELLALVGSVLRLANEPDIRAAPSAYPVLRLLWRNCTREVACTKLAHNGAAQWDVHSPIDLFVRAASRYGLIRQLPPKALLSASPATASAGWDHGYWRRCVYEAVARRSLAWLLHESEGFRYSHRSWRFGRLVNPTQPSDEHRYGAELQRLLGLPPCIRIETTVQPAELTRTARELVDSGLSFTARTLTVDSKRHAQLRARITLNRAAFHAVRNHRSKDPLAPRRCRQCPATPPETARHVLLDCPRYAALRADLEKKLHNVIDRIRDARDRSSVQWRRCIPDRKELLFHIILASPFVLAQIKRETDLRHLLSCTGDFLISVHDIRPT